MPAKPSKRLQISGKQLKALQQRVKARNLADGDWEVVQGLLETVECLGQALEEKDTSLGRLCKYLLGAPTETARNVFKQIGRQLLEEKAKPAPGKRPGHGRKPAAAYAGGSKITIQHPVLKPGDSCPGCQKGKVYETSEPSVFVHIIGQAPLKATVYERTRLRCNLCGEMYVPELPAEAGEQKYDDSAAAMLALLKYGCGLPLNRLEKLQNNVGQPVPSATQWDIINATAVALAPVHDALVDLAAQGQIIHNDDTTMKVLAYLKDQDEPPARKGIYTTGLLSQCQDRRIALFMTGDRHAGENLTALLARRAAGLCPPIQMCDAASRNESKEFTTIVSNCLVHARRYFVELVDRFPDECAYVIEAMREVYKNEATAKEQNLSPDQRLSYHQKYSKPVMDKLHQWARQQMDEKLVEPNSGLGAAIKYLLNHWEKLTRFLEVAAAPLDNNICERSLKHAILHRKNALFYKTQRGAYVGDMFMSLIHTCQLSGINPLEYLTWLLKNTKQIQKSPQDFLPWKYQPE